MSQNIQALALQSHALVGLEILGARLDDGRGSGGAVGGRVEGDDGEGCGHWEGTVAEKKRVVVRVVKCMVGLVMKWELDLGY
jgi:hypothetical protein